MFGLLALLIGFVLCQSCCLRELQWHEIKDVYHKEKLFIFIFRYLAGIVPDIWKWILLCECVSKTFISR